MSRYFLHFFVEDRNPAETLKSPGDFFLNHLAGHNPQGPDSAVP